MIHCVLFLLLDCISSEIDFDTTIQQLDPIDPRYVGELKTFDVENVMSICKNNESFTFGKNLIFSFRQISDKWKLSSISISRICRQ